MSSRPHANARSVTRSPRSPARPRRSSQRVNAGEAFDVAIMTTEAMEDLAKAGKVSTRTALGRSGIGIGSRAGAKKPDIANAEALKKTLLAAKSITYAGDGASRPHIERMMATLGIADVMTKKTHARTGFGAIGGESGERRRGAADHADQRDPSGTRRRARRSAADAVPELRLVRGRHRRESRKTPPRGSRSSPVSRGRTSPRRSKPREWKRLVTSGPLGPPCTCRMSGRQVSILRTSAASLRSLPQEEFPFHSVIQDSVVSAVSTRRVSAAFLARPSH